ncbi:MAG: aminotransferase class V-fold PLP-dependent enzyme [Oscillospiraceae bacterium]|jgi:cysteine desulfurase family protein|nr:aminotransferase class V-fold PLP-dependent enzyme [Oscillospiraceae bacterium]
MIYLDNAATSFPKPPEVIRAVIGAMEKIGANPGRAGHRLSLAAGRIVWNCREELARMLDVPNPENIVFGSNCTDALNLAIYGSVSEGDHVITTALEHNSVLRPINGMAHRGMITWTMLTPGGCGVVTAEQVKGAITSKTRLVVVNQASNVVGLAQPVEDIAKVTRRAGVTLLVDAAQSLGVLPVSPEKAGVDMVAFPGHKGLLGPFGTGALWIREGVKVRPLKEGGTGSSSESMLQPDEMPEALESGTLNMAGIAGLMVGTRYVRLRRQEIYEQERGLSDAMWEGLQNIHGVCTLTTRRPDVGVVSFNVGGFTSGEVANKLDVKYGIATRGGLHCAPAVHTHLGTLERGAVRASVGHNTTRAEVDALLKAVCEIAREAS